MPSRDYSHALCNVKALLPQLEDALREERWEAARTLLIMQGRELSQMLSWLNVKTGKVT